MKLLSARIQNFKSLEDVTLNFRDLTIIVGANATGKSNCLESLKRFHSILQSSLSDSLDILRDSAKPLIFSLRTESDNQPLSYQVVLSKKDENFLCDRELLVIKNTNIIDINQNQGFVRDEDGKNEQKYQSKERVLALKTAGDYGNKPLTSQLSEFMREWEFYDFQPNSIKENILSLEKRIDGEYLESVLLFYHQKCPDNFDEINQELKWCLGLSLDINYQDNLPKLFFKESDGQLFRLSSLSDGTLRIIGYCTLLHQAYLPPLIGIEEPEKNLHPAILIKLAHILKKLSLRTQVVITTHSSQLLDCFTTDDIREDVSVLLLSKTDIHGTRVLQLDQLSREQESLGDWMENFGIGSAVYHSNLLEEVLETQYA